MSRTPKVLHISADYPDANRAETTHAVRNFVTSNQELEYFVVSLNRVANPLKCNCVEGDGRGDSQVISMRYWGMPYGVFLALSMLIVAIRIRGQLKQRGINVDVIHAHKLTFEGLAAWFLACWLTVPLVLSVRGEAESKILRFKPHYKWLIKRMLRDAVQVLYVSAWFKPILNRNFEISPDKQVFLPNFVSENGATYSEEHKEDHLVTVLDLNVFLKKGLDRLLPAFKQVLKRYPNAKLDVIGRGSSQVISEVESIVRQLELQDRVVLKGAFDNTELLKIIPRYAGLVLPSHNETFGMIYVEALLCGIPILYSKNTGIDGFVDWIPAKVGVDATSVDSVAEGLAVILSNQYKYRQWLKENHAEIQSIFDRESYLASYKKFIYSLLACSSD